MFGSILRWFNQRKAEKKITESIRAFQNRTIHKALDPNIISGIPDSAIELSIFDCAVSRMNSDLSNEMEILPVLPIGMRALYATWLVEGEVNNGGFNQYFWNSSGQSVEFAIAGFKYFGANDLAEITERARLIWESEKETQQPFAEDGTIEAFSESYNHTQLCSLDDPFLDASSNFSAMRIAKIRQVPAQFSTEFQDASLAT